MVVDRSPVKPRELGDVFHGGPVEPLLVEEFPGGPQDNGSVPEDLSFSSDLFLHWISSCFACITKSLFSRISQQKFIKRQRRQ
jgi:hypothetical protein